MGMGSGGMVIIEMQRQMNAARGGQDVWGSLVFALGLYGLFGSFHPYLGSGILALGVAVAVRQDHLVMTMIDALDPQVRTSFPWRLWALLFATTIVGVQLGTIALIQPLLTDSLLEGAAMGSLMIALLPVGIVFLVTRRIFDPVRLGLLTEKAMAHFGRQ